LFQAKIISGGKEMKGHERKGKIRGDRWGKMRKRRKRKRERISVGEEERGGRRRGIGRGKYTSRVSKDCSFEIAEGTYDISFPHS
jgi:hypothetical protein